VTRQPIECKNQPRERRLFKVGANITHDSGNILSLTYRKPSIDVLEIVFVQRRYVVIGFNVCCDAGQKAESGGYDKRL
jgi:hypothetical protein